jgi:hypothetical protein
MGLAGATDDDLPGVAGKPRELIGGRADEVQAADHAKTTDFEYDTTGVSKSMAVGPVDRDSLAGPGQPLAALPADNPAVFIGGSSAAVGLAVRLFKGLPFAVGSQGIGRNKSLPEHGRPSLWISLLKKEIAATRSYVILSQIHPFFEFFATTKKRQLFGFDLYRFAGFGIATGIGLVIFYKNAAKTSNFNSFAIGQGIGHGIKKNIHDFFGLLAGETIFVFQFVDEIGFIHILLPNIN